ncbi:site-2 protease family protein [Nocardia otitidiscaviarum]|uniref:site-2 protease family protein n=1 Tax=Nocardia otitidiscaviarum TaxID=1823 RepID=UPI002B4B90D1|nr:site-2 protease family protein [Nocardia otitidiscaviarum]
MRSTIPLGQVAGIRIGANWSVLVTIALFTWVLGGFLTDTASTAVVWTVAVLGALALIACLLAHELAHSIVARRSGIRVEGIVLWLLGGVSELGDEPGDARTDLRVALAGPLTSLGLAVVAFAGATVSALLAPDGPVTAALVWLASVNAVLGVFNLLPGAPLDGGRVLRAVLWWRSGDRLRAATAAARSGQTLGTVLMLVGVAELLLFGHLGGLWLILLGWFLNSAANAELAIAGLRHRLGDSLVGDVMTSAPMAVPAEWTVAELLRSDAPRTGHRVFPVVEPGGRPVGVLAWADLVAAPERTRDGTHLRDLARELPSTAIVRPDARLADVASHTVLRPNLDAVAVVDADGRLTGLVTATDMVLACQRSALGLPVPTHRRRLP